MATLEQLEGWRKITGEEYEYVKGSLLRMAESERKTELFLMYILLPFLAVGFIVGGINFMIMVINRDFFDIKKSILGIILSFLFIICGCALVYAIIYMRKEKEPKTFYQYVEKDKFFVMYVKVDSISYPQEGSEGSAKIIDKNGNEYEREIPTLYGSVIGREGLFVHVGPLDLKGVRQREVVMPSYNQEKKYCITSRQYYKNHITNKKKG
ncbi:MAG: hypothetical protein K2I10_04975 [Lachnospiraceae bacterium]|nr:hypothetical protein [Lachnospiraceae bacterium]